MTHTSLASSAPIEISITEIFNHILRNDDLVKSDLDDGIRTRSSAVIILCHAEIEERIEAECLNLINTLEENPPIGFAFLAWGLSAVKPTSPMQDDYKKQKAAGGTVKKLTQNYKSVISNNHGIRKANIERLLLPLGANLKSLELDIEALDSFGVTRGEAAHLSPLKARLQKSPSVIKSEAMAAAASAKNIISEINKIGNAIGNGVLHEPKPSFKARAMSLFSYFKS